MMKKKIVIILIFLLSKSFSLQASSPNSPDNLRTCDKVNPVGTGDKPYFGWHIKDPDNNEIQTAYQIIIASNLDDITANKGDVWNSGKVTSRKQNFIFYAGTQLKSGTRYFWKVRTWDKDGNESKYSEPSVFQTGLFISKDWAGAKWIKRNTEDADDYTYYRKKITVPDKTIRRAITYITACHNYDLYINGKLIGKGFSNHYPQYSYYNAWDISSALTTNSINSLAILTHWYGGGQGRATGSRGLILKTVIEFTDETSIVIGTDNTWKLKQAEYWMTGQPQRNGEGIGRVDKIDSRKVIDDWNAINYNDSLWQPATEIGPHPTAPWTSDLRPDLTRVIEEDILPVSVTKKGKGKYIIDLGKIYPGMPEIIFSGGTAGDTIKMYGGFALNEDGTVSKKIDQHTNMNYYFIINGNKAVFRPMVYLGMQYIQVDNSPNELNASNVKFICRHFELDPKRSSFISSDPMLNWVWNLMSHSLIAGAMEGFVDTPTREKGPFLGDGWSQAVPAMTTMGDRTMNNRVLNEFLDSQDQYWPDGRLNAVYPNVDGARDIPDYTQSYLVWVWDYYMQTGNIDFLKANYNKIKKVADYVDTYKNSTTGLIHNLAGGGGAYKYGIIDWPPDMRYGYDVSVESRTVIDAYAYIDFEIISKIAGILGNANDEAAYKIKAKNMKDAINSRLINSQGVYIDGLNKDLSQSTHVSQHANMFPMAMGIVPQDNFNAVINEIKNRKMNVGMVTVRWLPEALGQADQGPHLIDLYTNAEWDGWAKNITQGATVTWESWNAKEKNESMSHPWGAAGLLGIQQYIIGISPLKPQHELIQVKPLDFKDKLNSIKGTLPTDRGDITVEWDRNQAHFFMTLTTPVNVVAKVYIPKCGPTGTVIEVNGKEVTGVEEGNYLFIENIGSGVHTFERVAGK